MTIPMLTTHRGYRLQASAAMGDDGMHAADLIIEKPGLPPRTFNALDYFYDGEQALKYATAWGRIWVDMKG
ncbi:MULTISPECIES: hypothetical protein [Paraburkholderia]|jgi:hypothetical protein|uniref:Uncharacterized protein n=4 Tax=Paraburkholderia TaxID=1822464 RepID=A0A1H6WGT6_9BURK|nr:MULTISPECIES: hypothetical protein [Paraburkholderia]MPW16879.1 hypothetical protein [Paraburkholderia franconis]SEJ16168.1 hypothetical protein SAMN05192539_1007113 [Paraburkholderia diazotrophica]SIT50529.1 conserved hypothetical protein [Paraburkholderia piptadeniae]